MTSNHYRLLIINYIQIQHQLKCQLLQLARYTLIFLLVTRTQLLAVTIF
jgi:hypothetical protein